MNYGKSRAFIGAYVALVVHVLLAAALGVAIAQLFSVTVLCFTTATVFLLLVAWINQSTCQPSWGQPPFTAHLGCAHEHWALGICANHPEVSAGQLSEALAYLTEFLRAGSDDDVIQERTGEAKEALQDQGGRRLE